MDIRLQKFCRAGYASLFFLLAPMLRNCWVLSAYDVALAAETVQSIPAISESKSQPSSADKPSKLEVPILVYHHIRQSVPVGSRAEQRLTVTAEIFDHQMKYLQDKGYHVIPFAALVNYLEKKSALPKKPVVISFDDGWEDQFIYAIPV